jgi:hypothetical protein
MANVNGQDNAVGNNVYAELPMTRYPQNLDKRGSNDSGGNQNLNLHANLVDYNMAEHVNALADAVMAIQKALGIAPQLATVVKDANGNTITDAATLLSMMQSKTVKSRLDTLEAKNFDTRYGGPTWVDGEHNTIQEHKHTGSGHNPAKVDLQAEVQGKLPRANLDLTYNAATGLTGANISINSTTNKSIDTVLNDKLSKSQGGTIDKDLEVDGKSWTRWGRDYDITDFTGDTGNDVDTLSNQAIYKNTNTSHTFVSKKFDNMYYGRYVMIVRMKTDTLYDGSLIKLSTVAQTGDDAEYAVFKGTDFKAANTWQNFYLIFNHEPNTTSGQGQFSVQKYATSSNVKVSLDYVLLTPVHPAVFDR